MVIRNGPVHVHQLKPSSPDTVALGQAVEERFLTVLGLWEKMKGERLVPPASMNRDMMYWRQMRVRHSGGDFRNTEAELKATKTIAQWTVDMNCIVRNQPVQKPIEWKGE